MIKIKIYNWPVNDYIIHSIVVDVKINKFE